MLPVVVWPGACSSPSQCAQAVHQRVACRPFSVQRVQVARRPGHVRLAYMLHHLVCGHLTKDSVMLQVIPLSWYLVLAHNTCTPAAASTALCTETASLVTCFIRDSDPQDPPLCGIVRTALQVWLVACRFPWPPPAGRSALRRPTSNNSASRAHHPQPWEVGVSGPARLYSDLPTASESGIAWAVHQRTSAYDYSCSNNCTVWQVLRTPYLASSVIETFSNLMLATSIRTVIVSLRHLACHWAVMHACTPRPHWTGGWQTRTNPALLE